MLEEIGGKNRGGSSGEVQGRGLQKRGLQRQRQPAGMEACLQKQLMQETKKWRIAGQESSLRSESTTCCVGKASMKIPRKKK